MKQYNISVTSHIEQFHDEVIDKIEVIDNKLVLYIDDLHFDYGNKFTLPELCEMVSILP